MRIIEERILDDLEGDTSQFLESKDHDEVFDLFLELVRRTISARTL